MERNLSHKLVSESLKTWLDRKKSLACKGEDSSEKIINDEEDACKLSQQNNKYSIFSKHLQENTSTALTDSAYDSLTPCASNSQPKPYKNYGNSFPRTKAVNNNVCSPIHTDTLDSPTLSYSETAELTAHVTQHLFENVSSAMHQWYERRLHDITEQHNQELSRRVALLEEQLQKAQLNPENPAEHLV